MKMKIIISICKDMVKISNELEVVIHILFSILLIVRKKMLLNTVFIRVDFRS